MRKIIASAAVVTAMVLGGAGVASAGNGYGNQCPKGTQGVHGQCVSTLAKNKVKKAKKVKDVPVTTTTTAPVVDPPVVTP